MKGVGLLPPYLVNALWSQPGCMKGELTSAAVKSIASVLVLWISDDSQESVADRGDPTAETAFGVSLGLSKDREQKQGEGCDWMAVIFK